MAIKIQTLNKNPGLASAVLLLNLLKACESFSIGTNLWTCRSYDVPLCCTCDVCVWRTFGAVVDNDTPADLAVRGSWHLHKSSKFQRV